MTTPPYEVDPDGTRWYTDLRDLGPVEFIYASISTERFVGRSHPAGGYSDTWGAKGIHYADHAFNHPLYPEPEARPCCMNIARTLSANSDQWWNTPYTSVSPPNGAECGVGYYPGSHRDGSPVFIGLVGAGCGVGGSTGGFGGGNQYVSGNRYVCGAALWVGPYLASLASYGPDAGRGVPTWFGDDYTLEWEYDDGRPSLTFDVGGNQTLTGGGVGAIWWGLTNDAVWNPSTRRYEGWAYNAAIAEDFSYTGPGDLSWWTVPGISFDGPHATPGVDPADIVFIADHSNVNTIFDYAGRDGQCLAVRLGVTARRYRLVSGHPPVRQYPRDDGKGLASAPRIHPPPKGNTQRVVGGFQ